MDVWEVVKILVRRWYVVIPILVLGAVGAILSAEGIQPEYKSEAVLLVLPPTEYEPGANDAGGVVSLNPYTALGPKTVARALAFQMNSDELRLDFAAQGLLSNYEVEASPRDPLISVTASGVDQELVARTMGVLVTRTKAELIRRQEPFVDAAVPEQLTIEELSRSAIPAEDFSSRTRLRIAAAALAVLVAAAGGIFVDGIVDRSKARRARIRAAAASAAKIDEEAELLSTLDADASSTAVGGGGG